MADKPDAPEAFPFSGRTGTPSRGSGLGWDPPESAGRRREMVDRQLIGRGIADPRVLAAFSRLPRERFVPAEQAGRAYADCPLAIGEGQTISQPYMVAAMAEQLALTGVETVLEVGAGSGYGAALLALLARRVVAVERLPKLLERASRVWADLGLDNIEPVVGDGSLGHPPGAPYDAISVTAAAPAPPPALLAQLRLGVGRLVAPVGDRAVQRLITARRLPDGTIDQREGFACVFVPLIGDQGW